MMWEIAHHDVTIVGENMSGILTYPVIVVIGSITLGWIVSEIHKSNAKFQKFILQELKHELRLVEADVYPLNVYAERLEELGEFIIMSEDTQGLISQVLKVAAR